MKSFVLFILGALTFTAVAMEPEPEGYYVGETNFLNDVIKVNVYFDKASSRLNFEFTEPKLVGCVGEDYEIENSDIKVENIDVPGNCINNMLSKYLLTFKSASYDSNKNTVNVEIGLSAVWDIKLELKSLYVINRRSLRRN